MSQAWELRLENSIERMLRAFLEEDLGFGDVTTEGLVDGKRMGRGVVMCKEPAVIAGLYEAVVLLSLAGCEKATTRVTDGEKVATRTEILETRGPAQNLLKVERVLLNLVSHMSGVATATRELVDIAKKEDPNIRIACTRKTLPGLRYFEKRAVLLGGGDTHRYRLDDMILIKDNHLVFTDGIEQAIKQARSKTSFTKKIEIEITKPEDAITAAKAGADIILLDNMNPETIEKTVKLLKAKGLRDSVILEGSGGINKDNIAAYARTGADVLSVGRITNSARSIDMSFDIRREGNTRGSKRGMH